jgi:AraC-like DNA-binding protein
MTPRDKSMIAGCSERTVAASAVRALMDFALSKGCSHAQLVERSRLDLGELSDIEHRLPLATYVALMKAGKELSNDPAFALHFGESDEGMESTFACMMGVYSPTMRLALAGGHVANSDRYRMTRNGDEVRIVDTGHDDFPEGAESSYARVVCMARRVFGGTEFFKAIHFIHAEPPYRDEYDRIFQMPLVFRSDCYAVIGDARWLDQLAAAPAQSVLEIVKVRAETQRQRLDHASSTRGRVEALLTTLLHTEDVSIDAVACKLGMGRHTLFRKLRAEGVTFTEVLNELRRTMANQYLSKQKLAVNETAYLLGFSDPAAFSRAYKRWTGHSPRELPR